jgi:hypothetical protein
MRQISRGRSIHQICRVNPTGSKLSKEILAGSEAGSMIAEPPRRDRLDRMSRPVVHGDHAARLYPRLGNDDDQHDRPGDNPGRRSSKKATHRFHLRTGNKPGLSDRLERFACDQSRSLHSENTQDISYAASYPGVASKGPPVMLVPEKNNP